MAQDNRKVRILEEPIGGQAQGEDGEYIFAEVYHRMRRGYMLHCYYAKVETMKRDDGSVLGRSTSFALFTSGKSVMVVETAAPYSAKKLQQAARAAGDLLEGGIKSEVLEMRRVNEEKREREEEEFERTAGPIKGELVEG